MLKSGDFNEMLLSATQKKFVAYEKQMKEQMAKMN